MFDRMRDRIAFVLICLVFIAIFGCVPSNLTLPASTADFNCRYDGAYDAQKFKALKYRKA